MNKIIVITGASSGFGRLTANALADPAHCLCLDARNRRAATNPVRRCREICQGPLRCSNAIELDVGSQGSVDAAVAGIINRHVRLAWLSTTPAIWYSGPLKPSRQSSWPNCMM